MTTVKFNRKPFNTMMDDFFTELPVLFKNGFNNYEQKGLVPVNVKETDKSYRLEVIAPGFEKTDFKVNVEQNLLTISADTSASLSADKQVEEKQIRKEYSFRSFKRSFTIDEKIDATTIEASYINGVLILNLPKKEAVKVSATEIAIK